MWHFGEMGMVKEDIIGRFWNFKLSVIDYSTFISPILGLCI